MVYGIYMVNRQLQYRFRSRQDGKEKLQLHSRLLQHHGQRHGLDKILTCHGQGHGFNLHKHQLDKGSMSQGDQTNIFNLTGPSSPGLCLLWGWKEGLTWRTHFGLCVYKNGGIHTQISQQHEVTRKIKCQHGLLKSHVPLICEDSLKKSLISLMTSVMSHSVSWVSSRSTLYFLFSPV